MIYPKSIFILFSLISVMTLTGCQPKAPSWPDNVISNIWIPENAKVYKYYMLQGSYQIKYIIKEEFPGDKYINLLSSNMARQGWKRLEEDFMNPGLKHSWARGGTIHDNWGSYLKDNKYVYLWIEDWENSNQDIIRYDLKYDAELINKHMVFKKDINVIAIYIPKEIQPDPEVMAEHMKTINNNMQEDEAIKRKRWMRSTGP